MSPDIAPAFEAALLDVADLLSDAHCLELRGHLEKAGAVYVLAEEYAVRSGFLELMYLVWAYSPTDAPAAPASDSDTS